MADDYQGREATLAYFGQLAQETGGTFRAELQHLAAEGDSRAVGIQRGRVTDGREHFEDLYAWDEFWS